MLLERQTTGVDEVEDGTEGLEARKAFGSRTSRERSRPDLTENVGDQDDEDGTHVYGHGLEVAERWHSVARQQSVRPGQSLKGTH